MKDGSPMQQHNKIDMVAASPDGNSIILGLCETRPWNQGDKQLFDLKAKLSSYLTFIESGQLTRQFPKAKGKPVVFWLYTQFELTAEVANFIELYRTQVLAPVNVSIEVRELK